MAPALAEAQKNLALVLLDQGRREDAARQVQPAIASFGPHRALVGIARELGVR